jgi:hypothetical protein
VDSLARAYAILGVRSGASAAEIRKRYRALVKVWHPDRFAADPQGQVEAAARMRVINEAYELILARPRTPAPAAATEPATAAAPSTAASPGEAPRRGLIDWFLGDPAEDWGWQAERRKRYAFGFSVVAAWVMSALVARRWPDHYFAPFLVAFGTLFISYIVLQRVLPREL